MHIVVESIARPVDGHDRGQRLGTAHRDLDGVEATPGNARHPDPAARPVHRSNLCDGLLDVGELGLRVLVIDDPVARTCPSQIETNGCDAPRGEVAIGVPVVREEVVVLAVGNGVEGNRERAVAGRVRKVEGGGQDAPIPRLDRLVGNATYGIARQHDVRLPRRHRRAPDHVVDRARERPTPVGGPRGVATVYCLRDQRVTSDRSVAPSRSGPPTPPAPCMRAAGRG